MDTALPAARRTIGVRLGTGFIRLYQITLSPWLGNQCRFHPTCSHYGIHAIETHGLVKGLWLTVKRIVKCQPFHPGGIDQVPEAIGKSSRPRSAK
ncbi:MAG: membrane protein insertion efficiency factor YidD [Pseudomonadaceae bacterium]|nr:membrane protein insertion efficiency factor YidD [Pseudomonadaceae bacterium]